jgi:serine/threonine-protein kinase
MTTPPRISRPLIAPSVDRVALFRRAEEAIGDLVELKELIAASRERALFVARDRILRRAVGVRVHFEPGTPQRIWFVRESELMAALDHPVLRPVYAAGDRGGWAYRILKWIEGESLLDAVERGPRPIPGVLQLARSLLHLLEYVHTQRIVVRRLIPDTVMIDATERSYFIDLRFANVLLDVATPERDPALHPFLAPEVREGGAGEPGSDLYGAAALLYFAVTGAEPAADPAAIVPPRQLRQTCPQVLERMILRSLRADPMARYLTAEEMLEDLLSDLGDHDIPFPLTTERYAAREDPRTWEKRLRRALGDDYELLEELGAGGFGRVYRVRDLALEREVALKVLHPYLTADPEVVERFRREARLAAQLTHPHIVNTYNIGGRAGLLWYTMEYVRGQSLARLVQKDGSQAPERVLRMLNEALAALQYAHRRGLVHRDLKPENILIDGATGAIRIADLGLAMALTRSDGRSGVASRSGTPEFAAPEQLLGEPVDQRADLYSLALVAWYAITGELPFGGGSVESVIARQTAGEPPRSGERVPDWLADVLLRGAARVPGERFVSADEFAAALRDARHPWRRKLRAAIRALGGR